MGCDGGTIPRRDELVRTKKKPEQKDRTSERAFKWKHCAISQEHLVKPVVACELGRLYNKETVLEFLLDRSKFAEVAAQFDHIRGLRDIKELNLTDNPERRSKDADKGDGYTDSHVSDYVCPVVGLEMSGKYKFCFKWVCGCVLSERALREVKSEVCHKCGKAFKEEDVITLNGSEEDVADLRRRMEERRALAKSFKKSKKGKHKATDAVSEGDGGPSESKQPCQDIPGPSSTSSSTTSSSTTSSSSSPSPPGSSHMTRMESKSKISNGHSRGKGASGKIVNVGKSSEDKSNGKGKLNQGIQNDPQATKTFKSLFTTCEAERLQKKPHWITYNPMYY